MKKYNLTFDQIKTLAFRCCMLQRHVRFDTVEGGTIKVVEALLNEIPRIKFVVALNEGRQKETVEEQLETFLKLYKDENK